MPGRSEGQEWLPVPVDFEHHCVKLLYESDRILSGSARVDHRAYWMQMEVERDEIHSVLARIVTLLSSMASSRPGRFRPSHGFKVPERWQVSLRCQMPGLSVAEASKTPFCYKG